MDAILSKYTALQKSCVSSGNVSALAFYVTYCKKSDPSRHDKRDIDSIVRDDLLNVASVKRRFSQKFPKEVFKVPAPDKGEFHLKNACFHGDLLYRACPPAVYYTIGATKFDLQNIPPHVSIVFSSGSVVNTHYTEYAVSDGRVKRSANINVFTEEFSLEKLRRDEAALKLVADMPKFDDLTTKTSAHMRSVAAEPVEVTEGGGESSSSESEIDNDTKERIIEIVQRFMETEADGELHVFVDTENDTFLAIANYEDLEGGVYMSREDIAKGDVWNYDDEPLQEDDGSSIDEVFHDFQVLYARRARKRMRPTTMPSSSDVVARRGGRPVWCEARFLMGGLLIAIASVCAIA